jgi:hypothetical protein
MLGRLISTIGLTALKNDVTAAAERAGRRAGLYAVAGILWLTAFGFLLAALAVWLMRLWGPIAACAAVGGGLAVAALIVHLILALSARHTPRPAFPAFSAGPSGLASPPGATAAPGGDIGALAVVAVLGWVLGRRMTGK